MSDKSTDLEVCDPWAFDAKYPERAGKDYDVDLARISCEKDSFDYDQLQFNELMKLRTS